MEGTFMERYQNLSGSSGISGFEIGKDNIIIQFTNGSIYLYDYISPGIDAVEKMKVHAKSGSGLCTYINQHVRDHYAARLK
ncbi:MAG TPA: hypothetical protein VL978_05385 [Puia sp.]|nr:hypothetical protein [Puia sp.]